MYYRSDVFVKKYVTDYRDLIVKTGCNSFQKNVYWSNFCVTISVKTSHKQKLQYA